jgi:nitrite reductase (cytochrome c-552)
MAEQSSRAGLFVVVALVAVLAGGLGAFLVADVAGKKAEQKVSVFNRITKLHDDSDPAKDIEDPKKWGENYPKHYDDYMKTQEMVPTKYGGSYAIDLPEKDRWDVGKKWPGHTDTRTKVAYSHIDKDASLQRMWRGYAFGVDFREDRGHYYMLDDQTLTRRQEVVDQSGNCMNCHASSYVAFMRLGDKNLGWTERLVDGYKKFNNLGYFKARDEVQHPITCIDCHNPENMALRITRPALMQGLKDLKKNQNYDVNKDATASEMRSYVCAQCHVEYYFGKDKEVIFPWHNGLKPDDMMAHYDKIAFRDWFHLESNAPLLKAQHPEFELWSQGIHARSGVSCADCHMPYKREGAMKISDHWIRSPNLNLNRACQSCHKWTEGELKARIEEIQDRTIALRHKAMEALMELIDGIVAAKKDGTNQAQLYKARYMQRRAQFYLDFVEAENSAGFHAPQESARLLGEALDYARQGVLALRDPNFDGAIWVADPSVAEDPMKAGTQFIKNPIPMGIQYMTAKNAPDDGSVLPAK